MTAAEALIIANATDTHGTTLHGLRKHKDASVRTAVAHHYNTYPETLRILSHDSNVEVLNAVVNNLNTRLLYRTIAASNVRHLKMAESRFGV